MPIAIRSRNNRLSRLASSHGSRDLLARCSASNPQVVFGLKIQPGFRRHTKIGRKAQSSVRGNGARTVRDGVNPVRRNVQVSCQPVDTDAKRPHEILVQNLARMDRIEQFSGIGHSASVTINYFHVMSFAVAPDEANPPLIVDPDTVRPRSIARNLRTGRSWKSASVSVHRKNQIKELVYDA